MVTRWKKWASLLSLALAAELLAVGLAGGVLGCLTLVPRGYGPRDAFQENYQDTAVFRRKVEETLEYFLMAARTDPGGQSWQSHYQEVPNLLYQVTTVSPTSGRETVVSNAVGDLTGPLPTGYSFRLSFQNGRVSIEQRGKSPDLHGSGMNPSDSLWNVPGYGNRPASPEDMSTTVNLVCIDQPVPSSYSGIYSLYHDLTVARWFYLADCAVLALGLLFLAPAILWRKARREARLSLARRTGGIWFEVKLLAVAALPLFFLWGLWLNLWRFTLAVTGVFAVLYPWVLYLAANDLKHNEKPWRNSLCRHALRRIKSGLNAAEAMLPMQRRFFWRGVAAAVCVALLAALALGDFMVWFSPFYYGGPRGTLRFLLALLLTGCLLTPVGWYFHKVRALVRELGPLTDHLAAVRAGTLATPLAVPESSDLAQAAEDLNGIQQGMRTALDERIKSERMKVELIANVSHDLKTPLTSVVSYAELLSEEEDLPRHAREYIRILSAKAQRLQVMVQDVFEMSKAASGELSLHTERLDLGKLLRQTLADLDEPIQHSTLAFRAALPVEPVWIAADGDRLYRVFQNLIQNALQYALEGSRVYVTLEVKEGNALAAVKNTSRDELPPNTDFTARFVRGDASRSDGGSGLGLAIASSFAAACGGSFRVETDADLFTAVVVFPIVE